MPKKYEIGKNNLYALENQLKEIAKNYSLPQSNQEKLTIEEQQIVIEKIREEQRMIKAHHFIHFTKKPGDFIHSKLVSQDP